MDLVVAIDGVDYPVKVTGRGTLRVEVAGRRFTFDVRQEGDGLVLEGQGGCHRVHAMDGRLMVDGEVTVPAVRVVPSSPGVIASAGGRTEVTPAMPGRIVAILVKPGDRVRQGQPLLVLEAMKMQNEVPAPRDGVVGEVKVSLGHVAAAGEPLVSLEGP